MIIQRAVNPRGWTSLPNRMLEDSRLSWRARGILAYLLSRPPGWQTDSERLADEGREGREAVRTALRELRDLCYLVHVRVQGDRGRWRTETFVYDEPQPDLEATLDLGENPENPPVDNPVEGAVDNQSPTPGKPGVGKSGPLVTTHNNKSSSAQAGHRGHVSNLRKGPAAPDAVAATPPVSSGVASGSAVPSGNGEGAELALDTTESAAIARLAVLSPGVAPFALRAHLVETLERHVWMSELANAASHLRASGGDATYLTIYAEITEADPPALPAPPPEGT